MFRVIDNFLDQSLFEVVKHIGSNPEFPWYYNEDISGEGIEKDCYFTHILYSNNEKSSWFNLVVPIIDTLSDVKSLVRIKANSYFRTETLVHHKDHVDYSFDHKAAIFYVNTNDGYTVINNEHKIESVANRILIFNPQVPHHSTNCTDQQRRVNVNFNYF